MFHFLYRELCHVKRTLYFRVTIVDFIQNPFLKSFSTASTSQDSFTVSYLKNSCGLSKEAAIVASKRVVVFDSSERPDSVLSFFRKHGFTKSQISKIIRVRPSLLKTDCEKNLKPKIEFFYSNGVSPLDFTKIVTYNPNFLGHSLKNHLLPFLECIKSVAKTNENLVKVLKRWRWRVTACNIQPNISVLHDHGVPDRLVSMLLVACPDALTQRHDRFNEIVKDIIGMGLDPSKSSFVNAIRAMVSLSRCSWESKLELYRRLGWSENELLMAFRKQPQFIVASAKKTIEVMDFVGKKIGLESSVIARYPEVFLHSLEKRTIPRCLVLQVLLTKGLIKKDSCLAAALIPAEERFLKKFVTKYQKEAPQLLKVYQRGLDHQGLAVGFEGVDEDFSLPCATFFLDPKPLTLDKPAITEMEKEKAKLAWEVIINGKLEYEIQAVGYFRKLAKTSIKEDSNFAIAGVINFSMPISSDPDIREVAQLDLFNLAV